MWILFVVLSMLCYLAYSLFAKYSVSKDELLGPYRIRISICLAGFISMIVIMVFDLGESGLAPYEILIKNPFVLCNSLVVFFSEFLYLFARRYVGISIEDSVSGIYAPLFFLCTVGVNLIFGKLSKVKYMLVPVKLIPILIMVIGILLLPNTEIIGKIRNKSYTNEQIVNRKKIIFGIIIVLFAVFCDIAASVFSMLAFEDGELGYIDYLYSLFFACTVYGIFLLVFIKSKKHEIKRICNKDFAYSIGFSVLFMAYSFLEVTALSFDAVSTNILWVSYPIVPIIASRIILKEKYTKLQYLCIGLIFISSIAFCVGDVLI